MADDFPSETDTEHGELSAPGLTEGEQVLVDKVFEQIEHHSTLMLLAQADWDQSAVIRELKRRMSSEQGDCIHLIPHHDPEVSLEEYFSHLGQRCGFNGITSAGHWRRSIEQRLEKSGNGLYLLVSRLEKGSEEGCRDLAAVLRVLEELYAPRLKVVLCGGERLAALRYEEDPALSLLNYAEVLRWQELWPRDVTAIWQRQAVFPDRAVADPEASPLDVGEAGELLDLSGGHPKLIRYCLEQRQSGRRDRAKLEESLIRCGFLQRRFPDFQTNETRLKVCSWLQQEELGPFALWPHDPDLRDLYWRNLLKEHQGQFRWRCEVIREVGRRVLECGDTG